MIVRLGVVVAASIAALTVKQLKVNNSKSGTCAYSPFFFYYFFTDFDQFTSQRAKRSHLASC